MTKELKTKLDWALYYQSIGLSIIPVGTNKISLIKWEIYENQQPTVDEINAWWQQWPEANPALITGMASGVVALDLDIKHGRTSKEFQIPPTISARSGGGGEHFFFKYPLGIYIKSRSAISGEGVDIRGEKGYILLAPSVNTEGGQYQWIIPLESKDDLAEMPEWLKKLTVDNTNDKKWLLGKEGVSEGSRNETAASMAGKILSSTDPILWESIGWDQLQIWNTKNSKHLQMRELRNVWESIKKIHENDVQDGSKGSQASILLESILNRKDVSLFHDEQGRGYISMNIEGHQEIWSCGGKKIKLWLSNEIHRTQEKAPTAEVKKSILSVLEGKACFEGSEIKLHDRVAWHGDEIFYDLTNSKWQVVKIAKDGWEIVDNPPTIFKRYPHHKEQVTPIKNGDVKLFLNYINVANPEHQLLLLVFLISCFIPDFPHVMLVVFGAQGSSKSTLSKLARFVVDPSLVDVASFPHSQRELIQALAHHYFLFFDNVSHITEEESDTLCKAITGGGHVKRELYENDEDIIYTFMRCIGMNGINLVTTRPDLLERSLLLELERIDPEKRKTEKELYQNFAKDLPSILGGIFDVLVKAIQIQPTIKLDAHHRMADWSLWGCAIAEALGYSKDEFLKAYQNNITRQSEMLLNENIVATTLFSFVEEKKEWEGTATELLQELYKRTPLDYFEKQEKYWPRSAASLMRKINELRTYLRQIGISVTTKMLGYERRISLEKIKEKVPEQLALTDGNYDIDDIIPIPTRYVETKDLPF
jgi:hypothetical protein